MEFSIWEDVPNQYHEKKDQIPKADREAAHLILKCLIGILGMTKKQLFDSCGIRKQRVSKALNQLYRLRIISRQGQGKKNKPFIYFFR